MDYVYKASLKRVIDGDTIDVIADLGFKVFIDLRVRLLGINAPEVYGVKKESEEYKKGVVVKEFVENWFKTNSDFVIKTYKDKQGKYGRWLAEIYPVSADVNNSKQSLNNILLENDLAVLYE